MTTDRPRENRWMRTALYVFVILTCLRFWVDMAPLDRRAEAQIPDSGAQRMQMVKELEKVNEQLSVITHLLKSETINVNVKNISELAPRSPKDNG